MMLPPLVPLSMFELRLPGGGVDHDDRWRAEAALVDASALIRAEAGKTWVDAAGNLIPDEVPDVAATITIAAARRAFVNPDGLTAESIADYSSSFANASADVYLTKAEKNAIRRAVGRTGLWTLATTRVDVGPDVPTVIPDGWELGATAETDPFGEGWST